MGCHAGGLSMTERMPADSSPGKGVRLLYAAGDFFPPWRLDVDELFSRQLPAKRLELTWAIRRGAAGPCRVEDYNGRPVWLPWWVAAVGPTRREVEAALAVGLERLLNEPGLITALRIGAQHVLLDVSAADARAMWSGPLDLRRRR